mgnify:CR=1 FL=1|nr:MAG TPA: minor tail protein Z [Caudoviricetes sp.]
MIEIKAEGIEYAEKQLSAYPERIRRAAYNAVDRTLTHLKKTISASVRKEYNAYDEEIKKTLVIQRVSKNVLSGSVRSSGRALSFNAFKIKKPKKGKGPLKVKIRKRNGAKTMRGAFIGVSKKGYTGVMQRKGKKPYPLRVLYALSVPQMVGNTEVTTDIEKEAEEYLNKRFLHEVDYQLGKAGK